MKTITINGRFASLNEYIAACRRNQYSGAGMIKKTERDIIAQLKSQKLKPFRTPVRLWYTFYEPNRRRDLDNVAGYFHKVFQDSLVKAKLLPDDGWDEIVGYSDDFGIDKKHPRIEIKVYEGLKDE